jgi:alkanesulfonate monooxygenase SsuD/methylene tetrahydromethanopterin reductase-like flavin-dependent oxidoreductase (luciferase family)
MTRQRLDAMLRAWGWTEAVDLVDVSTDYDQGVIAGRLSPSSFRKPHPLIGRATGTPATIVETARLGLPVILGARADPETLTLYRDALAEADHDAETISECEDWLGTMHLVSLARTEADAERRLDQYIEGGGAGPIVTEANEGSKEWVAEWRARQVVRKKLSLPVTPEMLVERLLAVQELGLRHVRVCLAEVPGRREENLEALHLFLEEVLPQLDPEPLRDPARTVLTPSAA